MSYSNTTFWEKYRAYKLETEGVHEMALKACRPAARPLCENFVDVVNLGSGTDPEPLLSDDNVVLRVDPQIQNPTVGELSASYEDPDFVEKVVRSLEHKRFMAVSFFSTEVVIHPDRSRALYDELFRSGACAAIVSGFYYMSRNGQTKVSEAGGLESFQSLLPVEDTAGEAHQELFRVTLPVPSALFGSDVVEVWRVLGPS